MSFPRRLRLDFSPAFFALLSLWGMSEFCLKYSEGDYPWSVNSAYGIGLTLSILWWVRSDALRRPFPLMPVWGAWISLAGSTVPFVYLFASRGWWGLLTLVLYGLAFALMSALIQWLV